MTYYVKLCPWCAAENHPSEITCLKCGKDLPDAKTESDKEPLTRPKPIPKPVTAAAPEIAGPVLVVVTDINMKFASMVNFMVKWAIATIPALFILILFGILAYGVIASMVMTNR